MLATPPLFFLTLTRVKKKKDRVQHIYRLPIVWHITTGCTCEASVITVSTAAAGVAAHFCFLFLFFLLGSDTPASKQVRIA